jgi:hypothetical protein
MTLFLWLFLVQKCLPGGCIAENALRVGVMAIFRTARRKSLSLAGSGTVRVADSGIKVAFLGR